MNNENITFWTSLIVSILACLILLIVSLLGINSPVVILPIYALIMVPVFLCLRDIFNAC